MSFVDENGFPKPIRDLNNDELDELVDCAELDLGIVDPHKEVVGFQLGCLAVACEDASFSIPAILGIPHPSLTRNRGGDPSVVSEAEWFSYHQNPPDDLVY